MSYLKINKAGEKGDMMVKDIKKILERPRESVSDKKTPPPKKNQKKGNKEMEMYTCTNCFSKVPADATMCLGCGSVFEEEEEKPVGPDKGGEDRIQESGSQDGQIPVPSYTEEEEIAQQSDAQEEQIQVPSSTEEEEIARILDSRNRQIHTHSDAEEEEIPQSPDLEEQHAPIPLDTEEGQITQLPDSRDLQMPDLSDIEEDQMAQPPDLEEEYMPAPLDTEEDQIPPLPDSHDLQMPDLSDIGEEQLPPPEIYSTEYAPQEQETQYPEEVMRSPSLDTRGNQELNTKQQIVKALKEYNKRRKNRYFYGVIFLGLSIVLFVLLWLVAVYQVLAIETDSWFGADIILLLVGAAIFFVFGFYLLLTYPESSLTDVFVSLSEDRRT